MFQISNFLLGEITTRDCTNSSLPFCFDLCSRQRIFSLQVSLFFLSLDGFNFIHTFLLKKASNEADKKMWMQLLKKGKAEFWKEKSRMTSDRSVPRNSCILSFSPFSFFLSFSCF